MNSYHNRSTSLKNTCSETQRNTMSLVCPFYFFNKRNKRIQTIALIANREKEQTGKNRKQTERNHVQNQRNNTQQKKKKIQKANRGKRPSRKKNKFVCGMEAMVESQKRLEESLPSPPVPFFSDDSNTLQKRKGTDSERLPRRRVRLVMVFAICMMIMNNHIQIMRKRTNKRQHSKYHSSEWQKSQRNNRKPSSYDVLSKSFKNTFSNKMKDLADSRDRVLTERNM